MACSLLLVLLFALPNPPRAHVVLAMAKLRSGPGRGTEHQATIARSTTLRLRCCKGVLDIGVMRLEPGRRQAKRPTTQTGRRVNHWRRVQLAVALLLDG